MSICLLQNIIYIKYIPLTEIILLTTSKNRVSQYVKELFLDTSYKYLILN